MCDKATNADTSHSDVIDALVSVLADEHTRHLIWYFQETDEPFATVDDLVDHSVESRSAENRAHIKMGLHHVTLPKLADAGVITYNARNGTARYRENPLLERMLRLLIDKEGT